MDFNPATFFISGAFGLVGMFYWGYGKRQAKMVLMADGVALMIYPWFVSGPWPNFWLGAAIAVLPWVLARAGLDF